jgi:glycosyltransferase involved in cell wall biosynthesis
MKCLYCTADSTGASTGAGTVTWNELESLRQIGETTIIDNEFFQQFLLGQQEPYTYDYLADARILHEKIVPDIACFYAGTFSKSIMRVKHLNVPVSYGCDAHDIEVSRDEFARSGLEFNLPHLSVPMLMSSYMEGYLQADLVTCPSKAGEQILRKLGCKNIVVIPHGVHIPPYAVSAPCEFIVGYFGQVGPDKGLRYLFRAWKKLGWSDVKLKFGGRGSELLDQAIKDLDIRNAEIIGPVQFTSDFYNTISVYVQPSATEGFGIEVLEAMAHGRPVIVSAGAGAADAVTDGVDGFVVPALDSDAIADRLNKVRSMSYQAIQQMGVAARRKMEQQYTWDKIRSMYIEAWKKLL